MDADVQSRDARYIRGGHGCTREQSIRVVKVSAEDLG